MFFIGYDCGTSSIKATLLDAQSGEAVYSATSPKREMPINAPKNGWAEQQAGDWWENLRLANCELMAKSGVVAGDIKAIGISYQMHGLVCVDKDRRLIRPSIIWCDSRAVECGRQLAMAIGDNECMESLLNLPGNFTAAKFKWVKDNEPENFKKIYKIMLPGDYIVMKMTGDISTTVSGLSEGIFWDFKNKKISDKIINALGIDRDIIPNVLPTFAEHGSLCARAAAELGLKENTSITYRAGDQPNNALSLNVLNPGEVAATAGTSGVVAGVSDLLIKDLKSRINSFAHVNYTEQNPRIISLLCISGTGILNSWLRHNVSTSDYSEMDKLANQVPIGSDGLCVLPFGNGAERVLENRDISACIEGLNFNTHNKAHLFRASQEGIVFGLNYGLQIMKQMGIRVEKVRAGQANMFLSPIFCEAFATITGATVELYNTDGSQGAARGAGIGLGAYKSQSEAFGGLKCVKKIIPVKEYKSQYEQAYKKWLKALNKQLS